VKYNPSLYSSTVTCSSCYHYYYASAEMLRIGMGRKKYIIVELVTDGFIEIYASTNLCAPP
jgi:hypothetical protein